MEPEDNSLDQGYEGSNYDSSLESTSTPSSATVSSNTRAARARAGSFSAFRYNRSAFVITGLALSLIILIAAGTFVVNGLAARGKTNAKDNSQPGSNYAVSSLPLHGLKASSQLQVGEADHLAVNGQLQVNSTIVLSPTTTPSAPVAGQIYYDKSTNQPYYYNGSKFVSLNPSNVVSVGGAAGVIGLGQGLEISGNQLAIAGTLLQAITNAGLGSPTVTSFQGLTGAVTLSAGNGITISGTTITNNGVTGLTSSDASIAITPNGNGSYNIIAVQGGPGSQAILLAPIAAQLDSNNGPSQHINKTGVGDFVQFANSGVNTFVVSQTGQITTGTINYSQVLGTPTVVNTIGGSSGAITVGAGLAIAANNLTNSGVTGLTGTANQISVSAATGSVTLSLPQDIAATSTPTFGGETLNGGLTVTSGGISIQSASGLTVGTAGSVAGSVIFANAGNVHLTTVRALSAAGQDQTVTIPASSGASDTVCLLTLANCVGAGGGVTTAGGTQNYLTKFSNAGGTQIGNSSLFDNGVSVGVGTNLPNASYALDINGNLHASGTLNLGGSATLSSLGAGLVQSNGSGLLSSGAVDRNSVTYFNSALTVGNGGTGAASFTTNGIVYGNNAGALQVTAAAANSILATNGSSVPGLTQTLPTAVQSNITGTGALASGSITAGFGVISTGNSITTSAALQGGTLSVAGGAFTVDGSGNLVTSGTANVQGSLTLGTPSTTTGSLVFANNGNARTVTVRIGSQTVASSVLSVPDLIGANDTICVKNLANCLGGGSGAANTALSNLTGVAINTTLLPGAAGTINLGSAALPFGQVYLAGTSGTPATNNFLITGASTSGTRTITLPDASGTVCLQTSVNCGFALAGSGVTTLNGQAGAVNVANASGSGGTVTLDNAKADTSTKGIATFNASNFSDNGSGTINTIQGIGTAASVQFGSLALGTGDLTLATGKNIHADNLIGTIGGTDINVTTNGTVVFTTNGGTNSFSFPASGGVGQVICTTGVTCASGGGTALLLEPASVQNATANLNAIFVNKASGTGNLLKLQAGGSDALVIDNSGNSSFSNTTTISTLHTNNLTPTAALSIGATTQSFTVQGTGSSTLVATGGGFTTTLGYNIGSGGTAPIGNVVYQLLNNNTVTPGTYSICTTAGNCVGSGGSVSTSGGTTNKVAKFTGSSAIGDSSITDNGTTVTVAGNLAVGTSGGSQLSVGVASVANGTVVLYNSTNGNTTTLQLSAAPAANTTIKFPNQSGTIAVAASGPLALDTTTGQLSCATCLTSGGGGGGGVVSLDSLNNVLTIANSSGSGATITIDNAKADASTKGIATFNSTNFTDNGSGTINTVQGIATSSTPTFAGLTLSTALSVANGGTGAATLAANGILYGNGTGAIQATAAAASSILATDGINVPALTQTLPTAVQGNITQVGALSSGSIASGFGTISTANNITTTAAVQGGTLSIASGALTVNGSGNLITTGTGNIQGSLTLGNPGATTGSLIFGNAANARTITIQENSQTVGSATISIPDLAGVNDTVCVKLLSNCLGGAGGAANTSLSNLTGVAINTTLLPGAAGTVNLGSGTLPFGQLYVAGTSGTPGTNNFLISGASTSGTRTITLPDASGTVCLQTSASCGFALSGSVVNSLNSLTGVVSLANASGSGATVTIDNAKADATTKGIATFNTTNFSDNGSGTINTVQGISSSATPTFAGLNLTSALTVANGGTGAATLAANGILFGNGTGAIQATAAAANSILATNGINVPALTQTLPSAVQANITGTGALVTGSIASGFGTISTGNSITTTAALQGGTLSVAAGAFTVDASGNVITTGTANVQGNLTLGNPSAATGSLIFANAANARTITVREASQTVGSATLSIPDLAGVNDTVCLLTAANCAGAGGGVTTSGGTQNYITKYSNAGATQIGNSQVFDNGSFVGINTVTNSGQLSISASGSQTGFFVQGPGSGSNAVAIIKSGAGTGDLLDLQNSSGTPLVIFDASGNLTAVGGTFSGNISQTGSTTFSTGTGNVTLNGNATIAGTKTLTVGTGLTSLGGGLSVTAGLSTLSGGATITGTTNVNTSGSSNTNINTGSSTGNLALGNATGTFSLTSSALNISTAGALTGVTGIAYGTGAYNFDQSTSTGTFKTGTGAVSLNGATIASSTLVVQGANAITAGLTGTNTGAVLFKGSTAASGTLTLIGQANPTNNTLTLPNETGTVCTTAAGGACSALGYYIQNQNAGTQASSNFIISGSGTAVTSFLTPLIDTPAGTTTLNIGTTNATSGINLNQNVAVAADKGLTIGYSSTGSATAIQVANNTVGNLFTVDNTSTNRVTVGAVGGCAGGLAQSRLCLNQTTSGAGTGTSGNQNTTNTITNSGAGANIYSNLIYINDTGSAAANNETGLYVDSTATTNNGSTINGIVIRNRSANAGNLLDLQVKPAGAAVDVVTISNTGLATFQAQTASATALTVQNTSGNSLLAVDTSSNQVVLGKASTVGGKLVFQNATNGNTVSITSATSGNGVLTLPAETGTVCTTASGGACSALSYYIQNQNSSQQTTSNFWISGSGRADTSIITPTVDTASAVALNIGATASQINLNQNVVLASGKNLTQSGAATFTTGTGSISLNGDITVASAKSVTFSGGASNFDQHLSSGTFQSGTGAVSLNGDTTIASGKNFTQSGVGSFSTGTGAVSLNGATTAASTLAVQGAGGLTLGVVSTTTGKITYANAGSANTLSVQSAAQTVGNSTLTLPNTAGVNDTVCLLTLANCAGAGGGITGTGTAGNLVKYTGTGATVGNSTLSESGTIVTASGSVVIQGANALTVGTASGNNGAIVFNNSTNANTVTLKSGASGSNFSLTLPTTGGNNGDCLQSSGAGILTFSACTGGAGGGVTSLDSQTGVLSLANSSGATGTITIDNAKADASTKGIATFNATNFSDNGTGTINTIQGISTAATPTFVSQTLTGANSLTVGTTGTNTGSILFKGSTAASGTLTVIGQANPTNNTLTLPNETGTLLSTASGVQLQATTAGTAQTGHFNISGTGIAATFKALTSVITNTLDTASAVALNIGATASQINLNKAVTIGGTSLTFTNAGSNTITTTSTTAFQILGGTGSGAGQGGGFNIYGGAGGATGSGGTLAVQGGGAGGGNGAGGDASFGGGTGAGSGGGGNVSVQGGWGGSGATGAGGGVSILGGIAGSGGANGGNVTISGGLKNGGGTSGSVIIKPQASNDTTTAVQIQNAGGTAILTADTTNGQIILGTGSSLAGKLVFNNATNNNNVTFTSAAQTVGSATLTIPNVASVSDTVCLLTLANCTGAGGGVTATGYTQNYVTKFNGTSNQITVSQLFDNGSGVAIGNASPAGLFNVGASNQFQVSSAGAVTGVGVNSGAGLLQGALGLTISGAIASINDNSNFNTTINSGTSTGSVTIGNSATAGNALNLNAGSTGLINLLQNVLVAAGKGITFASGAGNFDQSASSGTFDTGTGAVTLRGSTTIASGKNLTLTSGAFSQTFTASTASSAHAISLINTNAAAGVSVQGIDLSPNLSGTPSSGTNTLNVLNFNAGGTATAGNRVTNGLNFASATGYTNFINTPTAVLTSTGALSGLTGLTVASGGATITSGNLGVSSGNITASGTINGLTLTTAADGFTVAGGTTSRLLTVTGADITIGNTITPTSAGAIALQANGANAVNIANGTTGSVVNIGNTTSNPNIAFTGSGTFGTTTGVVSLNGDTNVASGKTLTVQGSNGLTVGVASTATGKVTFANSGSANTINIQSAGQTVGSSTLTIPNIAGVSDTVCLLTLGNCAGAGGGVTTTGGTQNYITKYNNAGATQITNSQLFDNGSFVGVNTATNSGQLSVLASATGQSGLFVQNAASATVPVAIIKGGATPTGTADLLSLQNSSGTPLAKFDNAGNLVAGTINTATISGGTLSGGTVSGGTLSGTAVNSLNVSGTAISGTGALTLDASGSNTLSLGGISTGDVLLGGGSASTGCTVTNATGAFACSAGLQGTTLTATAANGLTLGTSSSFTGGIVFKGSGGAGTLTVAGPTTPNAGNFTLSIPAITGNANICTDNSVCTGYAPASGSASYIQNQNGGTQASSNFIISGSGTAVTSFLTPLLDTPSGITTLNIGTTNASSGINLNQNTTLAAGKSLSVSAAAGATTLYTSQVTGDTNPRFTIGADGKFNFGPGSGVTDTNLYRNAVGVLKTDSTLIAPRISVGSAAANATTALIVTPNSTTDIGVIIKAIASQVSNLLEVKDSNGNTNASLSALGNLLTLGRVAASGTVTQGKLLLADGTTDNFGTTLQTATLTTGSQVITIPDTAGAGGTICLQSSASCGFAVGTAASYIQNQNAGTQASSNFIISGSGTAVTSFLTPLVDTASAGTLSIGTGTATTLNLGNSGTATNVTNITAGSTGLINLLQSVVVAAGKSISASNASVSGTVFSSQVTGDTNPRFTIDANGKLSFGGGSGAMDATLFRPSAGLLQTNNSFLDTNTLAVASSNPGISKFYIQPGSGTVAQVNRGGVSQTADLLQFQDSNGVVLNKTDANGALTTYGTNNTFGALATPVTTSPSATGTNFYYAVTATNAAGETIASNVQAMNANTSVINWTAVNGATGYKIYRHAGTNDFTSATCTGAGGCLIQTITNGTTATFTDAPNALSAGAPPTSVTGTKLVVQGWQSQGGNNSFEVQSSAGAALAGINNSGSIFAGTTGSFGSRLSVLTTTGTVGSIIKGAASQASDLMQLQDNNGLINASFNGAGNQLTLGRIAASGVVTQGKLLLADGTTDNFGVTLQVATQTVGSSTISIPNVAGVSDSICLLTLANCVGAGGAVSTTGGTQNYITKYNNAGATQLTSSQLFDNGTGVAIGNASPAGLFNVGASNQFQVSSAGAVTAVGVNSGAGLLQGALGLTISGGIASLNDNSNFNTTINSGTSTGTVTIGNSGTAANTVNINAGSTGLINLQQNVVIAADKGLVINYGSTGNTTALQVIGSGGSKIFTVDSNTGKITVGFPGNCIGPAQGKLCVIQTAAAAGVINTNSTQIFSLGGSGGTNYANYIGIQDVNVGTANTDNALFIDSTTTTNTSATVNGITVKNLTADPGSLLLLQAKPAGAAVSVVNISNTGLATFQAQASSAVALQVQNTSGNNILAVDTSANQVTLGTASTLAGKLNFLNATNGNNITVVSATSGSGALTLPAETGTICTNAASGACSALGFYIQNQNAGTQASSNFIISGSGTAVTSFLTPLLDTPAGTTTLNIGTTNATTGINLNQNTVIASAKSLSFTGGASNFDQSASSGTFATGTGNVSFNGNTTVATNKSFTANGSALFKDATAATTAFQIQNANGNALFNADTTSPNATLGLTNSSFEANTTGWTAKGSCTLTRITSDYVFGTASAQCANTSANDGLKYNLTLANSTQYTVSFYAKISATNGSILNFGYAQDGATETGALASVNNSITTANGWKRYSLTFSTTTTSGTPYIFIKQNDATTRNLWIDGVQIEATSAATNYREGNLTLDGTITSSQVVFRNAVDTTNGFQIQSANGQVMFNVDTTLNRFGIGTASPSARFDIQANTSTVPAVLVSQSGSSNILQLQNGVTNVLTVSSTGATVLQNQADSTAAFQVQKATTAKNVLTVDTTNGKLILGDGSASGVTGTLVLQNSAQGSANVVSLSSANQANAVALSIPADTNVTDTVCLLTLANCVGAGGAVSTTGGTQNYITKYNNAGATQLTSSQLFDNGTGVAIGNASPAGLFNVGASNQFQVSSAGAITAVGVNSGAGLLQGALGLTISGGIASINDNSNFNTTINSGTSTGTVTIGNSGTAGNAVNINAGSTGLINLQQNTTIASGKSLTVIGSAGTDIGYNGKVSGDANSRFTINANGDIRWGIGSSPTDTGLTRGGIGILQTGGSFRIAGATAGSLGVNTTGTGAIGLVVKATTGQTASLAEFQGGNAEILSKFDANGALTTNGTNNTFAALGTPVTTSPSSTGTNFYYAVTATNAAGETIASNVQAMSANTSVINWTAVNGATGYKIYRHAATNDFTGATCTGAGGCLIQTITNGTTVTFTDAANALAAGSPPTAPTGTGLTLQGWASQTANALTVQNSASATQFGVTASGSFGALGNGAVGALTGFASTKLSITGQSSYTGLGIRNAASTPGDLLQLQDSSGNSSTSFDSSGYLHVSRAAASTDTVINSRVTGDTNDRFTIGADGKLSFGPGNAVADAFLLRQSSGFLRTNATGLWVDNVLSVGQSAFANTKLSISTVSSTIVGATIKAAASQSADLFQLQDVNGLINGSFNGAGNQLTLGRVAASGVVTQGKLLLADGTADNFGVTLQVATQTVGSATISIPNVASVSDTVCLLTLANCAGAGGGVTTTGGTQNYITKYNNAGATQITSSQLFDNGTFVGVNTTTDNGQLSILSNATGHTGLYVQNAASATVPVAILVGGATPGANADLLQLQSSGGTVARFDNAGNLAFGTGANHTINVATQTSSNTAGVNLSIQSATGNGTGAGGILTLQGGTGGSGATGDGGAVSLLGGNAASTNGNGGNISLDAGTKTGSGTNGTISIGGTNASAISLGRTGIVTTLVGSYDQSGTAAGTFKTGGGAVSLNGDTTLASTKNLILNGTSGISDTYSTSVNSSAFVFSLTNTNTGAGTALQGLLLSGTNTAVASSGQNDINLLEFGAGGSTGSNRTFGINFTSTSGFTSLITSPNFKLSAAGAVTGITGLSLASGNFDQSASAGTFATGSGAVSINGITTVKPAASATALQVQNGTSKGVLTVDTSAGKVILGDGAASGVTGTLVLQNSGQGSSNVVSLSSANQANAVALSIPADTNTTDTICLLTLGNCSAGSGTFIQNLKPSTTTPQSGNFYIQSNDTTSSVTAAIRAIGSQSGDLLDFQNSSGVSLGGFTSAGALSFVGANTVSTTSGTLTLQAGGGTVSLGSSSTLTATGGFGINSGGANSLGIDTGGSAALNIGTSNASTISLGNATAATAVNIAAGSSGLINLQQNTTVTGNVSFAVGANRAISVNTQTAANTAGNNLTVSAATGLGTGAGGALNLQSGTSGSGLTGNGGAINLTAGASAAASGSGGSIVLTAGAGNSVATNGGVSIPFVNGGSATAFTVGGSSGNLFTVDTVSNHINLGISSCTSAISTGRVCVSQTPLNQSGTTVVNINTTSLTSGVSSGTNNLYNYLGYLTDTSTGGTTNTINGLNLIGTNTTNASTTLNGVTVNNPSANAGNLINLQSSSTSVFSVSNAGAIALAGATTLTSTFSQTGANTFSTGTGAVSLNSDTTVTGNLAFAVGGNRTLSVNTQTAANTTGNALTVSSAAGLGTGNGGAVTLQAGSSGTGATGNGGAVNITAGSATSTNGTGGNIVLTAGALTGSGTNGGVSIPFLTGGSAAALQVTTAASQLFTVDTTAARVTIGSVGSCTGPGNGRLCVYQLLNGGAGSYVNQNNTQTVTTSGVASTYSSYIKLTDSSSAIANTDNALYIDTSSSTNASATINAIYAQNKTTNAGSLIQLQAKPAGAAVTVFNISNTGAVLAQNQTDSTTALQVLNAAGKNILGVDSSNGKTILGDGAASGVNASLVFQNAAQGSTNQVTLTSANQANAVALSIPADTNTTDTLCLQTLANCSSGTLQTDYNNSSSPANILLAASKDFSVTTGNTTTTTSNILFNLACNSGCSTSGRFAIQNSGTDIFTASPSTGSNLVVIGSTTNGVTFGTSFEPTLNGTARHTRRINLSPEYAGAALTADGTNNTGVMVTDNMTSTPYRNYYKWTNTQGTAQDYDIWIRIPLPADYSGLPSGQTICLDTYASATTANGVVLALFDTSNAAVTLGTSDLTPTSITTWQNKCTSSITGGTFVANGYMTIDLKLTGPATTGDIRVGDLSFDYLSKY